MIDYLKEINDYGTALDEKEKPIARNLFNSLVSKSDWSIEKLYYAIQLLGKRPISKYRSMFYYPDFISEVENMIKEANELELKKENFKREYEEFRKRQESRTVKMIKRQEKPKIKYNLNDI